MPWAACWRWWDLPKLCAHICYSALHCCSSRRNKCCWWPGSLAHWLRWCLPKLSVHILRDSVNLLLFARQIVDELAIVLPILRRHASLPRSSVFLLNLSLRL